MSRNVENTKQLELSTAALRKDYKMLKEQTIAKYSLAGVSWSCGWRGTHQLAALRNLNDVLDNSERHRNIVSGITACTLQVLVL